MARQRGKWRAVSLGGRGGSTMVPPAFGDEQGVAWPDRDERRRVAPERQPNRALGRRGGGQLPSGGGPEGHHFTPRQHLARAWQGGRVEAQWNALLEGPVKVCDQEVMAGVEVGGRVGGGGEGPKVPLDAPPTALMGRPSLSLPRSGPEPQRPLPRFLRTLEGSTAYRGCRPSGRQLQPRAEPRARPRAGPQWRQADRQGRRSRAGHGPGRRSCKGYRG